MTIPFTQYLRPNGRKTDVSIDMPEEIETLAQEFIDRGGKFECEVLTTGHVSLTAEFIIDGEPQDIAIKICKNGPGIDQAVEALVRAAHAWKDPT